MSFFTVLNDIQAVVFDLDNTLVSSSLNFPLIRRELGCEAKDDLLAFIDNLPEHQKQNAAMCVINHELDDARSSYPLDGCHDLLGTIKQLNLKTAIITRNCKQAAELKMRKNDINISLVLTREDHPAKPSPESLLYLAKLWQIKPERILYVGDYLYDIQTAQNANSKSCLVSAYKQPEYAKMANLVVNTLSELNQCFIELNGHP